MSQERNHSEASGVPTAPNRILAIFVTVLLLVVVLVTVFSSRSTTLELSPITPAGTVQSYLRAVFASNNDQAAHFFAPESGCEAQNFDRAYLNETTRVDLVRTEFEGDRAQVWVKVEIASGSPFGNSMTDERTIRLVLVNGRWFLTGIPWPLYECGVVTK